MASSAQVKPKSRKKTDDDLESGRRKLEQFRKQKAEAKKASQRNNNITQPVDNNNNNIQQQNVIDSDETHINSSFSEDVYNGSKENNRKQEGEESVGVSSSVETLGSLKDLTVDNNNNNNNNNNRPEVVPYSNLDKQSSDRARESDNTSFYGSNLQSTSVQMDGFIHDSRFISPRKDSLQPNTTRMAGSIHEASVNQQESGEIRGGGSIGKKPTSISSYLFNSGDTSYRPSESSDFSLNTTSFIQSSYSAKSEETVKRSSRPSFLDSLNISRVAETQYQQQQPEFEPDLITSGGSQLPASASFVPTSLQYSNGPSWTSGTSVPSNTFDQYKSPSFPAANGIVPGYTDFSIPKQNDDFTALEQHIEDLTQEKFSLQRDLDASRALAESLASENSSMTDTYNQQRSIVNQLKDDMERLHQQIQAQMGELESVRVEYANAQLECNAADERSQILASEVISLEDKALRLRSNELKLERELETAEAEMSSCKKKLQILEKDRQDLQSTIKALQEEKKVLQTMVQKASSGGKFIDRGTNSTSRKNASTSTQGLGNGSDTMAESSNQETDSTLLLESDSSNTTLIEGFSLSVPADQMRVIDNINTLIAELAVEKEELVQQLSSELSRRAHVQELNKELSRKLEAQTQRLELLTAQKMAIDNVSPEKQQLDSPLVQEQRTPPIADEGDEVVERVLGWIMKMFPGGPTKRRTSKLF